MDVRLRHTPHTIVVVLPTGFRCTWVCGGGKRAGGATAKLITLYPQLQPHDTLVDAAR